MNCPSRTDDVTEAHPTWNQNPPFLAADLTTCQDLNGIANARTRRKGSAGGGSGADGGVGGPHEKDFLTVPPPQPDGSVSAGGWRSFGPHPQAKKGVIGGEGQPLRNTTTTPTTSTHCGSSLPVFWAWTRWIASVVCCAALLSSLHHYLNVVFASHHHHNNHELHHLLVSSPSPMEAAATTTYHDTTHHHVPGGSSSGTGTDTTTGSGRARLLSRRSTCSTEGVSSSEYNTPLHVGALLIILTVSFAAAAFPLIATRFPRLRIPAPFFFAVRHFGTGVLLATAFVHLLPTAFTLLGNDCLSSFWVDDYPAMPGAIALAGVFFVTVIEMVLQPARHMMPRGGGDGDGKGDAAVAAITSGGGCMGSANLPFIGGALPVAARCLSTATAAAARAGAGGSGSGDTGMTASDSYSQSQGVMDASSPPPELAPLGNSESLGRRLSLVRSRRSCHGSGEDGGIGTGTGTGTGTRTATTADAIRAESVVTATQVPTDHRLAGQLDGASPEKRHVVDEEMATGTQAHVMNQHHMHHHHHLLTPAQQHQKDILQCMMLEVGILFHSVFIGMTLSVSIGREFVIFLVAVAFHQMFEGLALGSRIAAIAWPEGSWQPWMMSLAYGCTTPIGQAIGLATHTLYNPESEFGLVLVGTMNAISSGLLVFASLVELLSEDFLSDESWRVLRGRRRVGACFLVFFGAASMSLVGAWA